MQELGRPLKFKALAIDSLSAFLFQPFLSWSKLTISARRHSVRPQSPGQHCCSRCRGLGLRPPQRDPRRVRGVRGVRDRGLWPGKHWAGSELSKSDCEMWERSLCEAIYKYFHFTPPVMLEQYCKFLQSEFNLLIQSLRQIIVGAWLKILGNIFNCESSSSTIYNVC